MAIVALACAALACCLVCGWIAVLRVQQPPVDDDSWRDKSPVFFRLVRPIINLFSHRVHEFVNDKQLEIVRDKLHLAGVGYCILPEEFVVARGLGLMSGVFVFSYCVLSGVVQSTTLLVMLSLFIPAGYAYPQLWLRDSITRRRAQLEKQFPFFLELIVLSMRAGLNFSSAVSHSVDRLSSGPVKHEFARVLRDIRTGVPRRQALTMASDRVKLEGISNFVAAVNQAEETGGELGNILTAQAVQRRSERFRKAEKLANQAPVKMLGPLVAFLFPVTFLIIAFPIYMRARESGALDLFTG